ncbi:MAG: DUF2975 domain-containing protein [Paludibacter sp.]|nr:DUF2975 domain-containing protein [Paludibacter sp.]
MNKRLKIIGILFGIIYIAIVGFNLTSHIAEISGGFMDGFNSVQKQPKNKIGRLYEIVQFDVQPKGERYNDELQNLKDDVTVKDQINTISVKIKPQKMTASKLLADIISGIFAFAMLFILIFIPILVFIIIRSIVKDDIFNSFNINRLRWIGYLLVAMFAFMLFIDIREYFKAKSMIELQNYQIVFTMGESYLYLIMGVATLLFAEILKISTQIKEENDLTI